MKTIRTKKKRTTESREPEQKKRRTEKMEIIKRHREFRCSSRQACQGQNTALRINDTDAGRIMGVPAVNCVYLSILMHTLEERGRENKKERE